MKSLEGCPALLIRIVWILLSRSGVVGIMLLPHDTRTGGRHVARRRYGPANDKVWVLVSDSLDASPMPLAFGIDRLHYLLSGRGKIDGPS